METKYITFQSFKGGIGKSTLAMIVATHLYNQGKKVLFLDTDFQTSVYNLRKAEINEAKAEGKEVPNGYEIEPLVTNHPDTIRNYLAVKDGKYDYILIDTAGRVGEGEKEFLLRLSDLVIIPIIASRLDLDSTLHFLDGIDAVLKNEAPPLVGIINKEDQTKEQDEILQVDGYKGLKLLKGTLKYLVRYRRNISTFEPINDDAIKKILSELKQYL